MSSAVAKGWSNYPLSDICFFQEGPGLRNWQYRNEGVKFINIRCIQGGDIDTSVAQHLSVDEVEEKYKHFLLDEGDYVLSSSGTIGRLALVKKHHLPLLLNTSVIRFRSIDEKKLDKLFLRHFLQSKQFFDKISEQSQGSAQVNFGPTHLKLLDVLLPPLPEQKKIASILTSVDEVIETTQKQIDKLQDLKKATMNELLTKGIGHTEFKDSELGRIPKSWEVKQLSDLCEKIADRDHTTPTYVDADEGIPIVSPTNLNSDMELDLTKLKYITPEAHEKNRKKTDLLPDDIIFSRIGAGLGKSYLVKNSFYDFSILHSLCQIRVKEDYVYANYLLWQMRTSIFQDRMWLGVQSIGVPDLGLGEIGHLKIPVCSLSEQRQTTKFLEKMQSQILIKKQKLSQTQSLKKSLMQDLLTGKVRVQVN